MNVKSATFITGAQNYQQLPQLSYPIIALLGRSNVGKSSLINLITNRKHLAKISSKPGKTSELNLFLINKSWGLLDMPGYGWAKTSKANKKKWTLSINNYLLHANHLKHLLLLIDSSIPPQPIDIATSYNLTENGISHTLIFTKIDKAKSPKIDKNIDSFQKSLSLPLPYVTVSALKRTGKKDLLRQIDLILSD